MERVAGEAPVTVHHPHGGSGQGLVEGRDVPGPTGAGVLRRLDVLHGRVERHGPDTTMPLRVDLAFSDEERAFAAEVRRWLADHLEPPPPFTSVADEVAWGRSG